MEFGLQNCATVKITNNNGIEILNGQTLRNYQDEAYKYMGMLHLDNTSMNKLKILKIVKIDYK